MDLNRATILGRLTRDPEARTTTSGKNVTSFAVATSFAWKDQAGQPKEVVEYHNVVAWRKLGEIVAQYMHKGSRVLVEGRLQTRSWEAQDGSKRYKTEIVADNVIMLDPRGAGSAGAAPAAAPAAPAEKIIQVEEAPPHLSSSPRLGESEAGPTSGEEQKEGAAEEISVEDIPF